MAEALAVVAIISSIVQLVDFSAKVIKRIDDFRSTTNDVPAALKDISVQLPLLNGDLKRTKAKAESGDLDKDTQEAVLAIVKSCKEHIETLDDILKTNLPVDGDSAWRKGKKALLSIKQDEKIHDISERLRDHVIYLTHHIVVDAVQNSKAIVSSLPKIGTVKPDSTIPFKRDPKNFVGREDLISSLESGFEDHERLALVGLGGIGKSQVAIEFAYRLREKEPDTWVFWVHVNTRARFKQSYADIASKLQLPKIEHPEHDALQEVTDWLNDKSHGRWLLILDNCDDLEVMNSVEPGLTGLAGFGGLEEKPLIEYIPDASHGKVLATSRSRNVALTMTDYDEEALVPVAPMSAEEAAKLFRVKLPNDKSPDSDIADLADDLGYIPLAIKQAAAYISISSTRMTISKYLKLFRKSDASQTQLLLKGFTDRSRDKNLQNSIILTWQISFDQIRKSNPPAAELLALMSSFDRQGIPRFLLCDEEDDVDFLEALEPLINFSLVTEHGEDAYAMHRLVQLTTQRWLELGKQQMQWWDSALEILARAFPEEEYDNWNTCQVLYPHAQMMAGRSFTSESSQSAASNLSRKMGLYDKAQGRYEAAHQRLTESYEIRKKLFGENDEKTLMSLHSLGGVLEKEGKWQEAETLHRKTLAIRRRRFGSGDVQTLESTNSLCLDLFDEGKYDEARELLEAALKSEELTLGKDHPVMLTSMSYLGEVLAKQGHLKESVDMHRRVLEVQDRVLPEEHPLTLETVNHLGRRLSDLGLLEEAEAMLERAYTSKKKILGRQDLLPQHDQLLTLTGPEHPGTLDTLAAFIDNQERQGKLRSAASLLRTLVDLSNRVFGTDHPTTLQNLNHLAFTLCQTGVYPESFKILDDALAKNVKSAGAEHPLSLNIRRNIAKCWKDSTDPIKGAEIEREVLAAQERTLGPDSPDTIITCNALAQTLGFLEHFDEAQRLNDRALRWNIKNLGPVHTQTLDCYENQAFILMKKKSWPEAAAAYRSLTKTEESVFGFYHPTTLLGLHNLSCVLLETGNEADYVESELIQRRLLVAQEELYGWEHDITLAGAQTLGRALFAQGRLEEAEELCEKTLATEIKVLGRDHWRTKRCGGLLEEILKVIGKPEELAKLQADFA